MHAPGQEVLVHVLSGVLRVDLVDVRRKHRLFLHLALPGDHILLPQGRMGNEEHCASALTPVTAQVLDRHDAPFDRALQAVPQTLMRRHAEAMQLKAAPTITRKIDALFEILSIQAGIPAEGLYRGSLLRQVQIASILGVAPESVSRAVRDMRPPHAPGLVSSLSAHQGGLGMQA
ncbi:MAG: Crp/Fnr family transcriptional regulator [Rhodoferax sp.]|nr:MAG: Crp/Fnr family transcriptional regulator [Rhodoferax sp.]